jgi:hypothetical protein
VACWYRPSASEAVSVQVPLTGSKSSAAAEYVRPSKPAAVSTSPEGSRVALWPAGARGMGGAGVQRFVPGS